MTLILPEGFEEITFCGPNLRREGYKERQTFLNLNAVASKKMLDIGNLHYLYHGTGFTNILGITQAGLRRSSSGMLGPGIYLAPDVNKAVGYLCKHWGRRRMKPNKMFRRYRPRNTSDNPYYKFGLLLKCRVALGKVFSADKSGDYRYKFTQEGYHSVGMEAGVNTGWGRLRGSEYIIYDEEQLIIEELHIYEQKAELVSPIPTLPTPPPPEPKEHPCLAGKRCCIFATHTTSYAWSNKVQTPSCSKMLLKGTQGKKEITEETFKSCTKYQEK